MRRRALESVDAADPIVERPFEAIPWPRIGLGVGLSVALLWLASRHVDLSQLGQTLASVRPLYVLLATGVYFVDLGYRAFRWRVLLGNVATIPTRRLYPVLAIAYMVNNLLPVRVGELSRAYLVGRRERLSVTAVLASVAIERLVDGLTVVVLLVVSLLLVPSAISRGGEWVPGFAVLAGVTFGLGTLFFVVIVRSRRRSVKIADIAVTKLPRSIQESIQRALGSFVDGLTVLRDRRRLGETAVVSIAIWITGALIYILIGLAFDVALTPIAAVVAICVVNLATAVPLAPAGLGTFEVVAVQMFVLVGVSTTTALGMTIVLHGVLFFPVVIVGLVCLWRDGLTIGHLWRRTGAPNAEAVTAGANTR